MSRELLMERYSHGEHSVFRFAEKRSTIASVGGHGLPQG